MSPPSKVKTYARVIFNFSKSKIPHIWYHSFLEVPRSVDVLASAFLKLDLEKNFSLL